jgi:phage terminase large subunit-like protein
MAESGNVKLVSGSWNSDFLDAFELFSNGPHDEIVDATFGAFKELTEYVPLGGTTVQSIWRDH